MGEMQCDRFAARGDDRSRWDLGLLGRSGILWLCEFLADGRTCFFHDRVFQAARHALENIVVERLLPKHLLEPHLARAHRTRRFLNLRHGSAPSANAELIGVLTAVGVAD